MRSCPARVGRIAGTSKKGYEMPIGTCKKGLSYQDASANGTPFYDTSNDPYWPTLKNCPAPSQFVLLIECYNTLKSGEFQSKVSSPPTGTAPLDTVPPIQWHSAVVNFLFGDGHAEAQTIQQITVMDSGHPLNPASMLN
jgi:prepilin-type processing-associated H-X9-DG protein